MSSRMPRADTGVSVGFVASAVIHLAVFLLLLWHGRLFPPQLPIQETYYVDIVNQPVNEPARESLAQRSEVEQTSPPASKLPMALPSRVPKATPPTTMKPLKPVSRQTPEVTESDFTERMAKLERSFEVRREEAVLEKLRNKVQAGVKAKKKAIGAVSDLSGSNYADYIKSRLEDALKVTCSYATSHPEVVVRLTLAPSGRLIRMQVEHSSGDAAFELAVRRAIDLAGEKFPQTPDGAVFENGFVFRPKGISRGLSP